jgi:endonuclease YncB( thermonuclease family)
MRIREPISRYKAIGISILLPTLTVALTLVVTSCGANARPIIHPPFTAAKDAKPVFIRCSKPLVYDGDTVKCASGYRLRLLGVQAPEKKCRKGIECISGDAEKSRQVLADFIGSGRGVTYQYYRRDNRSRPVVVVRKRKAKQILNGNCAVLANSDAIYKWDMRRVIARECGITPPPPIP